MAILDRLRVAISMSSFNGRPLCLHLNTLAGHHSVGRDVHPCLLGFRLSNKIIDQKKHTQASKTTFRKMSFSYPITIFSHHSPTSVLFFYSHNNSSFKSNSFSFNHNRYHLFLFDNHIYHFIALTFSLLTS